MKPYIKHLLQQRKASLTRALKHTDTQWKIKGEIEKVDKHLADLDKVSIVPKIKKQRPERAF